MLSSPQVHRDGGLSYVIYFNEGNEPPHVHVFGGGANAKFWLQPVALCANRGFKPPEIKRIHKKLVIEQAFFMEQWRATQAQKL